MKLIICIDEKNGMLFNNRRQSKDRVLISHIIEKTKNEKFWITSFSQDIFDVSISNNIVVDDKCFEKATMNEYCFIENLDVSSYIENVDEIILYNWNRHYPADLYFNIPLNDWKISSENEFKGSSHEKITEKIYVRREI